MNHYTTEYNECAAQDELSRQVFHFKIKDDFNNTDFLIFLKLTHL